MANYISSNLQKGQAILTQQFNSAEKRFRDPVTFKAFLASTPFMIPDAMALRTREDRAIETAYLKRTARALGTSGRAHNHTGAVGDSGVIDLSWTPYSDVFKYTLKQADKNLYNLDQLIANEFGNIVGNFAEGLESVATSYIQAERSLVNAYNRQGQFYATNGVFEIKEDTEGDRAVQITKTMMDANKFQGMGYVVFCDSISYDKFEKQANQGSSNSTNLSFQFSGMTFIKSLDLDALAIALGYTAGYWIVAPNGTFGALDWIPKQNREGIDTKVNKYGTLLNPVDGLTYATHEYEERVDGTAGGGNGYKQDVKKEVEVSIDLSLVSSPLSTTDASVFYACGLVSSYSE